MPDEPQQQLPPHDLAAEENALGAALLSGHAIDAIADVLTAADFYRPAHARIFEAILRLHNDGLPVDAITVSDALHEAGVEIEGEVGGRKRLHEIATLVPATTNAAHYARIVRDHAILRALLAAGGEITRLGWDRPGPTSELLERAEQIMFNLAQGRGGSDFVSLSDAVTETVHRLVALHEDGKQIIGVPSGYGPLDALTSGFQPGNLILVAARPSMGKSAIATGVATNVAFRQGLPVALFTLEMSRFEITQRILSGEALVESQKLRNGQMAADEWKRVMDTAGRLAKAKLFIDDNGMMTVADIRSKARRLKLRHPDLAVVIVDYIQLMGKAVSSSDRVNEIAQISRALKILAGELEVPVVALSQLSRNLESRHDKRPILSDLRESGALEQDADLVIFIYRDEVYNPEDTDQQGIAELILAKHRNGPTDTVKVAWVKRFARFSELPRPGAGDLR